LHFFAFYICFKGMTFFLTSQTDAKKHVPDVFSKWRKLQKSSLTFSPNGESFKNRPRRFLQTEKASKTVRGVFSKRICEDPREIKSIRKKCFRENLAIVYLCTIFAGQIVCHHAETLVFPLCRHACRRRTGGDTQLSPSSSWGYDLFRVSVLRRLPR
jgi:hypothetical protein